MLDLFATSPLFADLQARGWFPGGWRLVLASARGRRGWACCYVKEAGLGLASPRGSASRASAWPSSSSSRSCSCGPCWVVRGQGLATRARSASSSTCRRAWPRRTRDRTAADQWRAAIAFGVVDPDKGHSRRLRPDLVDHREDSRPPATGSRSPARPSQPASSTSSRAWSTRPVRSTSSPSAFSAPARAGPTRPGSRTSRPTNRAPPSWRVAFDLINRDDTDAPARFVIVTDGRENAGPKSLTDLARECARRKIPIHVYGVGSSSYGQLRLRDMVVPDDDVRGRLRLGPVRYSVRGITDGNVDIVLNYDGREVAAKRDIPVREGDDLREVLTFVPHEVGRRGQEAGDHRHGDRHSRRPASRSRRSRTRSPSRRRSSTRSSRCWWSIRCRATTSSTSSARCCATAASRRSSTSPRATSRRCAPGRRGSPSSPAN